VGREHERQNPLESDIAAWRALPGGWPENGSGATRYDTRRSVRPERVKG
jgi:hypothetical protein